MKLLRTILAGILLISMLLPLAACGSSLAEEGLLEETATQETETQTAETKEEVKLKKYSFKEYGDSLRLIGERTNINDSGLLIAEWCGSGFEVNVNVTEDYSDILMGTRFNYSSNWVIYLDGVRQEGVVKIGNGNKDTVIVSGVSAGLHSVRVIKDTQVGTTRSNYNNLMNISLMGEIAEKTAADEKEVYLEFVGDGYFTGFGALGNTADSKQIASESSFTASVPYLVSESLNADYSVISHSQMGFALKAGSYTIDTLYAQHNAYRDQEYLYTPERTPDVIVIHAGMDDTTSKLSMGDFILRGEAFIAQIRSYYGEGVPVVWLYGTYYYAHRSSEIQAIAERGNNIYAFECEFGQSGAGTSSTVRYPSAAEHKATADILTPFIQDLLNK